MLTLISLTRVISSWMIGQLKNVPGVERASLYCLSEGHPIRPCNVLAYSAPCTSDRLYESRFAATVKKKQECEAIGLCGSVVLYAYRSRSTSWKVI